MKRLWMTSLVAFLFVQPLLAAVQDYGLPSLENLYPNEFYVVSFNYDTKIPNWAAYELTAADLKPKRKRNGKWRNPTSIPSTYIANNKDYKRTSYDKGHLVPSADMVRSSQAMQWTFSFANCAPQAAAFNRGAWEHLESDVRRWAKRRNHLVIYTGVFFTDRPTKFIGRKVAIPDMWYKVIYDPAKSDAVCFVGKNSGETQEMEQIKIDKLEELTGLDFLDKLPADKQKKIENRISNWR
jgi:endonuclease G